MDNKPIEVVTVTPNQAIDQTLTIPNFVAGSVNRVGRDND
jgi:fructose-1-phosphate kinase PfkB-like protein